MVEIWATTWQNQQSDCGPSEDSDQPGHAPSLIRVFAVRMKKAWVLGYPLSAQQRLIRLGGCPSWSESSLGAKSLCWFCHVAAHLVLDNALDTTSPTQMESDPVWIEKNLKFSKERKSIKIGNIKIIVPLKDSFCGIDFWYSQYLVFLNEIKRF